MFGKLKNVCTKNQYMFHRNGTFSYLKKIHFSYLKMTYFSFLKMPDFRIWNGHFFVFAIDAFFVFEIGTIFVFVIDTFFGFEIATLFRIWKRHISYFKTAHFVFNNKKALWQSNMGNANIRNVKIRGQTGKYKHRKLEVKFLQFKFELTK